MKSKIIKQNILKFLYEELSSIGLIDFVAF